MVFAKVALAFLALMLIPMLGRSQQLKQESPRHFAGIVLAVNSSGEIAVQEAGSDGARRVFTMASKIEIEKAGKAIALDDVKVGDPVSVSYVESADESTIRSMKVLTTPEREPVASRP